MPHDALLPRFPGSKRTYLDGWYDAGDYDAAIAPFMGSARWECFWADKVQALFSADADRSIQACWQCWMDELNHEEIYSGIEDWKGFFAKCEPIVSLERIYPASPQAWLKLKEIHEASIGRISQQQLCIATLVLRQLTFGGVVRESAQSPGTLNIKWEAGQLAKLKNWQYEFPPIPEIPFRFGRDYLDCVKAFERSDYQNAIALIDGPYYAGTINGKRTQRMTAAYPGHKPHDPATMKFFTESVEGLAATKRVSRMIVTCYYSDELDEALYAISKAYSLPFERKTVGELKGINQGYKARTKRLSPSRSLEPQVECEWELGLRASNQLCLAV